MFSYGSGLAASFFVLSVVGSVDQMRRVLDLKNRLNDRTIVSPQEYVKAMEMREAIRSKSFVPLSGKEGVKKNCFYLKEIDEKSRRFYELHE